MGWIGVGVGVGSLDGSWLEFSCVIFCGKGFLCFVFVLKILGWSLKMMDWFIV